MTNQAQGDSGLASVEMVGCKRKGQILYLLYFKSRNNRTCDRSEGMRKRQLGGECPQAFGLVTTNIA